MPPEQQDHASWLTALQRLTRAQFEELLFHCLTAEDRALIPNGTQTEAAIALIRLMEQRIDGAEALEGALREVAGSVSPRPRVLLCHALPGPGVFVGREDEIARLDAGWSDPGVGVVQVCGVGGEGKTALVSAWLDRLMRRDWDGASHVLVWSFAARRAGALEPDVGEFLHTALGHFGEPEPGSLPHAACGARLAALARDRHALIVIDALERCQDAPHLGGSLKDSGLATVLRTLATQSRGLCVVTTRQPLIELEEGGRVVSRIALGPLDEPDCVAVLRNKGVRGTEGSVAAMARTLDYHALSAVEFGRYVGVGLGGDARRWFSGQAPTIASDPDRGITPVMRWYTEALAGAAEGGILGLFGLLSGPMTREVREALLATPVPDPLTASVSRLTEARWNLAADTLARLALVRSPSSDGALRTRAMVRWYFEAHHTASSSRAAAQAHERLFGLFAARPESHLAAAWHGVRGGRVHESLRYHRGHFDPLWSTVDRADVLLPEAIESIAQFFEHPWVEPRRELDATERIEVFRLAALYLTMQGRLQEAIVPRTAALDLLVAGDNWQDATRVAGHLSDLYAERGDLLRAQLFARRAVRHADSTADEVSRGTARARLARLLHAVGDAPAAQTLFANVRRVFFKDAETTLEGPALRWSCEFLVDDGDLPTARACAEAALVRMGERVTLERGLLECVLARALLDAGELDRAGAMFDRAVEHVTRVGHACHLGWTRLRRGASLRARGMLDAARRDLEAIRDAEGSDEWLLLACDLDLERARLALAAGDPDAASAARASALDRAHVVGYRRSADAARALDIGLLGG